MQERYEVLDRILAQPVFRKSLFPDPVMIESVELLHLKGNYICRVRSTGGATGHSVSNNAQMRVLFPISVKLVNPFFVGKDARDLEKLLEEVYVHGSNYKLQNLALWIPVATIEMAILDMLGRMAGRSMGELIGDTANRKIHVYQANNYRGKSVEESLEGIRQTLTETGAKAIKFKIGGRMSAPESPPGRTEKMIPLMRKTFGEELEIFADSNGSYDVPEAIRIGKLLENNGINLYEEPVPFDWYEETRAVAEALAIPVAGGEQEPSMRNFRWLVANKGLDILQQDIFYFGGFIRGMKVALMGNAFGMPCMPHISGSGLGYLYMAHFVSVIPNAGKFHEFKGIAKDLPFECPTSSLQSEDGIITVPTGPGSGIELDPGFVDKHQAVELPG